MKQKLTISLISFLLLFHPLTAQEIIPKPVSMTHQDGEGFSLDSQTTIRTEEDFLPEAELIAALIREVTGLEIPINDGSSSEEQVIFFQKINDDANHEKYTLASTAKDITLSASEGAGIYYGGMTLVQLLKQNENSDDYTVPLVHIEDQPRFGWRGLMLDCSRTFISKQYLKQTIDRLSFYKLNTLHLHLTDDQGWRLEIEKRPLLTSEGAYFGENYNEPSDFEGYYTQEDIRELLDYASQRHVQIVPEIEVPGHSSAAIHAYPELSCSGRKVPIYPLLAGSPAPPNDVFCAGNEDTYTFFEEVLEEVTSLFPAPYVHLGGDEVSKHHWKSCSKCQGKMKSLGLEDEEHLQRHMMGRVSQNLEPAGKRPIGWDEILDGDAGQEWIVMAWRGHEIGTRAAKNGYDVVLSPTSHLYFDYNYRTTPTKKVYAFEPIPEGTTASEELRYMGIQANFWSHIDRTESRIDFMIYPRALALAERAWSRDEVRDYEDFDQRKKEHLNWLKFFDVKYNGNDNPEPSPYDTIWD